MEVVVGFISVGTLLVVNIVAVAVSYGKVRAIVNGLVVADKEFKADCHERHKLLYQRCFEKHQKIDHNLERQDDRIRTLEVKQ